MTANANGEIYRNWTIPSTLTFNPGNYTINATSTTVSWLSSAKDVVVVIIPTTATIETDNPGSANPKTRTENVWTKINDSDDIYANIVSSQVEVYLDASFSNVVPDGYNINSATLYKG